MPWRDTSPRHESTKNVSPSKVAHDRFGRDNKGARAQLVDGESSLSLNWSGCKRRACLASIADCRQQNATVSVPKLLWTKFQSVHRDRSEWKHRLILCVCALWRNKLDVRRNWIQYFGIFHIEIYLGRRVGLISLHRSIVAVVLCKFCVRKRFGLLFAVYTVLDFNHRTLHKSQHQHHQ